MNWKAVRRTNAARSARKAKAASAQAARKAFVAESGGPVTLAEVKAATVRMVTPNGSPRDVEVWTIRGKDWVAGIEGHGFFPYVSWRYMGVDDSKRLPTTPAARKWLNETRPVVEWDGDFATL
jgi:hypothetical protein